MVEVKKGEIWLANLGLTIGSETISFGWNSIVFSGTVTVNPSE